MTIQINNPNPFGSLSKEILSNFDKDTHIHLPVDYCDFLLINNGGNPIPSFFWIIPDQDGSGVNQFYGLHDDPEFPSLHTYAGKERYGVPKSILPIGDDGLGNLICLGINSSNFGKVFFFDHDIHPNNDCESTKGISKVANSFSEFLLSLRKNP
jgi:hypothetical protein